MTTPLDIVLATPWTRQGEWGGTTLSRSLTYAGMQKTLPEWTGIAVGYESFLHSGSTTYIATGQYERFAHAYLARLQGERAPLRHFAARFDALLQDVEEFLGTLTSERDSDEKIARYVQLHQQMQPYSYVFGYGEDQIVGELLTRLLQATTLEQDERTAAREAALSPPSSKTATTTLAKLRTRSGDARAFDFADLVRRQSQVRTDRRVLWNRVEEGMRYHLARRCEKVATPMRLLLEATPQELVRGIPRRSVLESRIGTTFLAHTGEIHLITGEEHDRVNAALTSRSTAPSDELTGQTAFPGLVRGRVRIVTTIDQGDALQRGEILVSDMTTPDLTTACERAAAIVTDRGGILCHAALVAREMKIPCVLATEHATRTFRDGDLVEVDAHRGIVRRIAIEVGS